MTVFTGTLRRIFKQSINWAFLLAFPVLCFILLSVTDDDSEVDGGFMRFGVVDKDNTVLSQTLTAQLARRYSVDEVAEEDISAVLIDQFVPWVLVIEAGFEQDVLSGNTELTTLEGYSLTVSEMSELARITTENITRALLILGTADAQLVAVWEEASAVEIRIAPTGDNWNSIAQWLSMFGYISIFTAYFVIKTLMDDKRLGMPDRVGVLPVSARKYLLQGTLAAFLATEVSVLLTLAAMRLAVGAVPNALLLFLLLSMFNLFAVSLILTITSHAKSMASASVAMTMIATLSSMLGGLFWPLAIVPDIMKQIARFTPGYWFGEGLRNVRDATFGSFYLPLLVLFAFAVITLLIGGIKRVQKMDEDD
jgi:ABC-2 type transport system permease protein